MVVKMCIIATCINDRVMETMRNPTELNMCDNYVYNYDKGVIAMK